MRKSSPRSFFLLCGVLLPALISGSPAWTQDVEDETSQVVVRKLVDCPEIILGDAQDIQWLGLSNRGFLGIEASALTAELRQHFGAPQDVGILVGRVVEESAAATAGLRVGDVITRVGDQEISTVGDLGRAVRNKNKGDSVAIELWRNGSQQKATATLQGDERCSFDVTAALAGVDWTEFGALGAEISGEALESALEGVRQAFEGVEWQEHLKELEEINLEGLEERLEQVHERLQSLEKELEGRIEREMSAIERDEQRVERELARAEREQEAVAERALVREERELVRIARKREAEERRAIASEEREIARAARKE